MVYQINSFYISSWASLHIEFPNVDAPQGVYHDGVSKLTIFLMILIRSRQMGGGWGDEQKSY